MLFAGISLVFITTQVWLDLKLPDYMSEITQLVQTEGSAMSELLQAGGMMLLCALGSLAASVVVAVIAAKIATNFAARVRSRLFGKVQSFSMEEMGRFSTASLITRSTNDITQVQNLIVMGLQAMIKAPILTVWAIVKISGKSWQWTFATGVAVAILILIFTICIGLTLSKNRKLQKLTDDLNNVTRETLTGLRVVRAYNAEHYQEEKFERTKKELTNTNLFVNRTMSFMQPGIQLVMSSLSLAIYWIGAVIIQSAGIAGRLELFSDMVVFSSYAMQVLMAFMMLVMIFIMLPRAAVSAKRINEVLETTPVIKDGSISEASSAVKGEVEFKNVSFRYYDAEEYVIKDISFQAHKGEFVALIGSTGCGKSTVVNLLPRFYDATEGEIFVDGVNIKDFTQYALHNKLGYVSQRAVLFSGTVKSNVSYGDNGRNSDSQADIVEAVYTAQASDFVESMEGSYEGTIAQGGSNLSGGQKQRLSIARALHRRPEILILYDSFSALDYKTDRKLRTALNRDYPGITKLVVAQRIGTIRDADRILVLEDGLIVGNGTHDELMQNCEVYRQIAYSQLSEKELA